MKRLICFLFLIISSSSQANEMYIGGVWGFSDLNYDLRGQAYEAIVTDPEIAQMNSVIQTLGGRVDVETEQSSTFRKLFFGYRFNKFIGLEVFHVRMHNYSISAEVDVNLNPTATGGNYAITSSGNVNALYSGTANFKGTGLRINGFFPASDSFDLMAGFGIMSAKSDVRSSYNINATYDYSGIVSIDETVGEYSSSGSLNESGYGQNETNGSVPTFAIGILYRFSDNFTVRAELERFGHPIKNLSIDTIGIGLQYSIK